MREGVSASLVATMSTVVETLQAWNVFPSCLGHQENLFEGVRRCTER